MKIFKRLSIILVFSTLLTGCGEHKHTFSSEWSYDNYNHWKVATCEHTEEIDKVGPHTLGKDGKCNVCSATLNINKDIKEDEWINAFGINNLENNPYYLGDNFELSYRNVFTEVHDNSHDLIFDWGSITVDGNLSLIYKMRNPNAPSTYYQIVDSKKYEYTKEHDALYWNKQEVQNIPFDDYALIFKGCANNYSLFYYIEADDVYKCGSLVVDNATITDISIKINDKKISSVSCNGIAKYIVKKETDNEYKFDITYGGQSLSVPRTSGPSI